MPTLGQTNLFKHTNQVQQPSFVLYLHKGVIFNIADPTAVANTMQDVFKA